VKNLTVKNIVLEATQSKTEKNHFVT